MTVFPKDPKIASSASEMERGQMNSELMTEWTKVVKIDHAGKLTSKHDSNDDKLRRSEEQEEHIKDTELRSKEEKLVGNDAEKEMHEASGEESDAKPSHSYIALIAMAILSKPSKKVLLGDIYNYISDKFPYYRTKDKSWRNSIRHNLSLNECFIKAGRSENGKGNYWAIHPANLEDFANGDFRRRRARRRVRKNSSMCARYTSLPYPQQAFMNYRSTELYHHYPYYVAAPYNCVRKSSFAIDNLLSSARVPTVAAPALEYSQLTSPMQCPSALLRSYPTTGVPYSAALSPPGMAHTATPYLALPPPSLGNQIPTESWNDTWKKLKAQFHQARS